MGEKTYGELLKDPRWQRKRLEIMQRDEFECLHCGARDKTLHVNHRWYASQKKPWEYDDHVLETLCEECHAIVTKAQRRLRTALSFINSGDLIQIVAYVETLFAVKGPGEVSVSSFSEAQGMADALGVCPEMVIAKMMSANAVVPTEDLEKLGNEIRRSLRRSVIPCTMDAVGTDEVG